MKVKIDDTIYDCKEHPIMLILTDQDKENIKNMLPACDKYALFPKDFSKEEIANWMESTPKELANKLYIVRANIHTATICSKCKEQMMGIGEKDKYCTFCGAKFDKTIIQELPAGAIKLRE